MATPLHPEEEAFVAAFVANNRRDRYRTLLASTRRRKVILGRLNHVLPMDLRAGVMRSIPVGSSEDDILRIIRNRGPIGDAHLISDDKAIDGRTMPIAEAVREALAAEWGTVICCTTEIALWRPEAPAPVVLLLNG